MAACSLVTMVLVMSETLPLAEIKAHLSEVVDRVVNEIDDDERVVSVLRIDHRADVYRPR